MSIKLKDLEINLEYLNNLLKLEDSNKIVLGQRYGYYAIDKKTLKGREVIETRLSKKELEAYLSAMIKGIDLYINQNK